MEKENIQKNENSVGLKKIIYNLIIAIIIMMYFVSINILYANVELGIFNKTLEISTILIMIIGIVLFEIAYKKDSGVFAIYGIEFLVLAVHSLLINHVIKILNLDLKTYVISSSYLFCIYYVLKTIIIYTNDRRKYLKGLSDIPEIVKEEPVKKEASKKEKEIKEEIVKEDKKTENTKQVKNNKNSSNKKTSSKNVSKKKTKTKEKSKEDEKEVKKIINEEAKPKKRGRPKKEVKKND